MAEYIVEKHQTSGGWTWTEPKGELIRCRDCKAYLPETETLASYCPILYLYGLPGNAYCFKAQRRKEE